MDNGGEICPVQLISGDGNFNDVGMDDFANKVKMNEWGISYSVVSIMGPQSSGKSTLLNHLYGTKFREMDADEGRNQTTQGIWLAIGIGMERHTLVMDLEGTDGNERGEDDTAFQRRSALFALAISDVLLVNMWCIDVGCYHAGNIPLLRTVFQVMLQLSIPRKPTLMFVLRDQTRSPLEKLDLRLRQDIEMLWNSIRRPQAHQDAPLTNFFNVEVEALISFELCEEQFEEQVTNLRHKISNSIASGAHGGDQGAIDGSSFSFSARQMWEQIKANNDLDLPAPRVQVATVRCEEIANNMFTSFTENEKSSNLKMAAQSGVIPGFRNELTSIIDNCLAQYDEETRYFDEGVRLARRNNLEKELQLHFRPTSECIIGHLRSEAFDKFKDAFHQALNGGQGFSVAADSCTKNVMSEFDIGCADVVIQLANWDTSKEKKKLGREIAEYIGSVCDDRLSELTDKFKEKLCGALDWPVKESLEKGNDDTWPDIRNLLVHETESAVSGLSSELATFNIDETMSDNMLRKLKDYARGVVESKAKEEAGHVLTLMKDRFAISLHYDSNYQPRVWSGTEGIKEAAKAARSEALKLLSVMAAIRLDVEVDDVKRVLSRALVDDGISDPLASDTWEGIPSSMTLLSPLKCESLWKQFMVDTDITYHQAICAHTSAAQTSVAQDTGRNNRSIVPAAAPAIGALKRVGRFFIFVTTASRNLALKPVGRFFEFVTTASRNLALELVGRFPEFVLVISALVALARHRAANASSTRAPAAAASASTGAPAAAASTGAPAAAAAQEGQMGPSSRTSG